MSGPADHATDDTSLVDPERSPRASIAHAASVEDPGSVTLDAAALAELAPFGDERSVEAGDILFRAGDADYPSSW